MTRASPAAPADGPGPSLRDDPAAAGRPGVNLWLPACGGWAAGTALQVTQPALWGVGPYLAFGAFGLCFCLCLGAGLFLRSVPGGWRQALAWCAFAACAFGLCGLRSLGFADAALDPRLEGRDLIVTGVVGAMPQHSEAGLRFRFDVASATQDGAPVRLPPRIELGWYRGVLVSALPDGTPESVLQSSSADLRAGDRWQLQVRLKAPHGNRNPHGFDFELALWERGIQATGYVRAGPRDAAPRRLDAAWRRPVERLRQAVRDAIFARVPDRALAGVIAALTVGDQNAIERADWDLFRATGVAHLVSISGLHITMFAWLAAAAVGWLWRRSDVLGWRAALWWPAQHAGLAGGVLLATGYAVFSGWGVPSQRTIAMLATVGLLRLSGRHWPWPVVWALACAVVLAADPWAMLQAGFWLSFVAVGVLFATDAGMAPPPAPGLAARALGSLRAMLREQWVVTLALAPLSLLLFQQVSLVGLLANLVAIPWVTLVVTPLSLLGIAVAPLWDVAGVAVTLLAAVLRVLAAWPLATLSAAAPPLWIGIAGLAGGVLLVLRLPWALRLLGVPLLLPALWWQAPRPAAGSFELTAVDIGQGNALLVRTASHALVYDAGPRYGLESDAGHRVLVPLLRALGERVDTLVLSHRDSDHSGGAEAVLASQPQTVLLSSIEAGHPLQAVRTATRCEAGQSWDWDGVHFAILHPQGSDYATTAKSNAMSCVLRISAGAQAVLLVGDIEQAQEAALVGRGGDLHANVLLVPHHGSKTSSSDRLLDAVQPDFAWVQAGYRNRFGHPAASVVARYEAHAIRIVETSRCGAIVWSSAAPAQLRCEREHARRYWQHLVP